MASDIIKLLPDSVANQIAAGEVVQRPASVVKELVENSVDAEATSIQIIIKDGGRTLIQVVDNGKGMTPTDARMAFERHATSKITTAEDLGTLHTMGFRGEALPSIAAMAQIELRTMPHGESVGSCLQISESRFEKQEPCTCVPGTNIMVKNLFFHIPARRKYLKKDSVELTNIIREFERLALVNSDIEFSISHNGVILHQLTAGTFKQRISSLFGRATMEGLIPISTETSLVKIDGFVGRPSAAKKRNAPQFFFVNGRYMRHPYFHKAIMSCYSELISSDSQPAYFINLRVDPSSIDVNIHPQKYEIKFENESAIWQILTASVKQSLGKINATGAIDFNAEHEIESIPIFNPNPHESKPGIETDENYNPFDYTESGESTKTGSSVSRVNNQFNPQRTGSRERIQHIPRDWDVLYQSFNAQGKNESADENKGQEITVPKEISEGMYDSANLFNETQVERTFITLDNRYIITPSRNGLLLIHRRRAHIRILFDQLRNTLKNSNITSQRLIFPETITLSPSQSAALNEVDNLVQKIGFDVSYLGDNVWSVNSVPALSGKINPVETLSRIISEIEDKGTVSDESFIEPAAMALARSIAYNHTDTLSDTETDTLIAALFTCSEPSFTPDGLTILYPLGLNEIQKLFN